MEIIEVMRARHSVRQYTDQPIPEDVRGRLSDEVAKLNAEGGLNMQLFFDEPECFKAGKPHYGQFSGARNYLAIVGKKAPDLDERAGYYGEPFVLLAQELGLNSCWVALTHGKTKAAVGQGEKLVIVIPFGYGKTQGVAHKSKPVEDLCSVAGEAPEWFTAGMEAAALSPTAMNQQKFLIGWDGHKLTAKVRGIGAYAKVDLGIVKRDFELASGRRFDA